jgi:hypothetical protein
MIIDEVFHDDQGYGHYLDIDTDSLPIYMFYKINTLNENISTIENDNNNDNNKFNVITIPVHSIFLLAIAYLTYSLLFKKL